MRDNLIPVNWEDFHQRDKLDEVVEKLQTSHSRVVIIKGLLCLLLILSLVC